MDVERILRTLSQHGVDYILIGGMNFLINHSGPLTYDVDVFVRDTPENLRELNFALQELACEWGAGRKTGSACPTIRAGWKRRRSIVWRVHTARSIFFARSRG